jgi:HPt (histidine-containing phosphotransfer) domain-containing protein
MTNLHLRSDALQTLANNVGLNLSELVEIVDIFIQESSRLVDDMHTALQTADVELLKRTSHTLKSSSVLMGAMQLHALSKMLDDSILIKRAVRPGEKELAEMPVDAAQQVQAIMAEYHAVAAALQEEKAKL